MTGIQQNGTHSCILSEALQIVYLLNFEIAESPECAPKSKIFTNNNKGVSREQFCLTSLESIVISFQ